MSAARFYLGRLLMTPGAMEALERSSDSPFDFLSRHQHGDWGEVDYQDRLENERSVDERLRILSTYRTRLGDRLWVITEADRSATTLLLPSEY